MIDKTAFKKESKADDVSRRRFLKVAGTIVVGATLVGCGETKDKKPIVLNPEDLSPDLLPSKGYLLVDTKKCQGCVSCMLACSLANEGKVNMSLSRIQIMQDPFGSFPNDITMSQCRQCVEPACVDVCPEDALHIDTANGNVRRIDADKCIGCKACIEACPFDPSRSVWNFEAELARKCDLCTESPHWKEEGGIGGKQACVSVCPVAAIKFVTAIPVQEGDRGYNVNLRGKVWESMGYPID
jgi:protein NrfC